MASRIQPALESNFLTAGTEAAPGYRLCKRLGAGGFGEVWEAEGPGGFHVALKIVRLGDQAAAAELRSLDILKTIRHPNLLTTFGAWESNNWLVIAMELADRTLWDRFREAVGQGLPGIPRDELQEYVLEAAKGIDYLNAQKPAWEGDHSPGVQHRDIKPQNILLVGNGVKVADFGLARLLEHTVTGHTGGMTVAYAPPEFFRGQTFRQSDQYSLAVTYCELRGGRLPFSGSSAQVMAGHLMHSPDLQALPEEEQPAVARALAKEPKERWPNCRSLVEALHACRPSAALLVSQPSPSVPVSVDAAVDRFATAPGSGFAENQRRSYIPPLSGVAVRGSGKRPDTVTVEGSETDLQPPVVQSSAGRPGRRHFRRALLASLAVLPLAAGFILWTYGTFKPSNAPSDLPGQTAVVRTLPVAGTEPAAPLTPPVVVAKSRFSLLEPAAVAVKAGCRKTVAIRFQPENQANATALRLENLPAGVTANMVAIPAGQERAAIELSASETAGSCEKQVAVVAWTGGTESRAYFHLTVLPPPRLELTLPSAFTLEAGRSAILQVQLERDGYQGPVKLQFEGLRKGMEPLKESTIPADRDKYSLPLTAALDMDEILQPVKVIACAGLLRAEARFQLHVKPTLELMHLKKAAGYDDLIHTYTEAIRIDPKDAVAYYNRGYVYNVRGEFEKAIADCSEALAIDPNYAAVYGIRGYAYNAKHEYDKALADCTEAIRLNPTSAFARKERGCAYAAKREYDKAIADSGEAIRLAPNYAAAYSNRAAFYTNKGEYDKAIADCDTALRLDPKLVHAYNNRGNAYLKQKNYAKAITDCNEAIQRDPNFALPYYIRGDAFYFKQEYDLAIDDFTEAIRRDFTLAAAFNDRGLAHYYKQEYAEAEMDFTQAIRLNPRYAFAYNNRGMLYQLQKDLDKAIGDFTEAIRLAPKYANAYSNRGLAHHLKGDHDEAIADCDAAIRLDPKCIRAFEARLAAFTAKGDEAHARADREQIKKLREEQK